MKNSGNQNYRTLLAWKSFWLFTGRAMPVIILFLVSILYSRRLSYDDYGKFQSVWMYSNIINIFISFGITSILLSSDLNFLFAFARKHSIKITAFYSVLSVIVLAVFFWYGKNFSSSTRYLLIGFMLVQNMITFFETLLIKTYKEKWVFTINVVYSALFFACHYYILIKGFDLNLLLWYVIVLSILKLTCLVIIRHDFKVAGGEIPGKDFFKHWAFIGINDIVGVLAKWIDKLFLLYLLTAAEFAVFFNGSFEIPLFALLGSVIGSILLIDISANLAERQKVIEIFSEGFRVLSLIVFPLFLFLFFFRQDLFAVVFKNRYDASIPIFLVSIFILPVRINNYSSILQCYSAGNKILLGSVLDISIAIVLMLILYPVMGTKGVALSIVISTWCQAFYYLWQSARLIQRPILDLIPLKLLVSRFAAFILLYWVLHYSLHHSGNMTRIIISTIFTALVILISLYFYFVKNKRHVLITEN